MLICGVVGWITVPPRDLLQKGDCLIAERVCLLFAMMFSGESGPIIGAQDETWTFLYQQFLPIANNFP